MNKLEFARNRQLLTCLIQESRRKLKKKSLDIETRTRVETNLQLLIQERDLATKGYDEGQTALLQLNIENILKELKKGFVKDSFAEAKKKILSLKDKYSRNLLISKTEKKDEPFNSDEYEEWPEEYRDKERECIVRLKSTNNYGLDEDSLLQLKDELKEELIKELKLEGKDNLKENKNAETGSLLLTKVDPISDMASSFLRFYKSLKEMKSKE